MNPLSNLFSTLLSHFGTGGTPSPGGGGGGMGLFSSILGGGKGGSSGGGGFMGFGGDNGTKGNVESGVNTGLRIGSMIPGPQQPFVAAASMLAPFFEKLF